MKKIANLLYATLIVSVLAGLAACNDSKEEFVDLPFAAPSWGGNTAVDGMPAIFIDFSRFVVTPSDRCKIVVANSKEELESYVQTFTAAADGDIKYADLHPTPKPDLSKIDFSKKTVLLVGGNFDAFSGGGSVRPLIRSFRYLPSGKYELDIMLAALRTTSHLWYKEPKWFTPVLIDKIGDDSKFEVKLSFIP